MECFNWQSSRGELCWDWLICFLRLQLISFVKFIVKFKVTREIDHALMLQKKKITWEKFHPIRLKQGLNEINLIFPFQIR